MRGRWLLGEGGVVIEEEVGELVIEGGGGGY
jgi:hypothetical protein